MREMHYFELENGPAVPFSSRTAAVVEVQSGQLWITVEADPVDYWLGSRETLALAPGARAWFSAETGPARFSIGTPARAPAVRLRRWLDFAVPRVAGKLPVFGNGTRK